MELLDPATTAGRVYMSCLLLALVLVALLGLKYSASHQPPETGEVPMPWWGVILTLLSPLWGKGVWGKGVCL